MRRTGPPALISAHRPRDLEAAIASGADYVEVDVWARADGFVVAHDRNDDLAAPYDDVLRQLVGRVGAHVDLKLSSDDGALEIEAARRALDVVGPEALVVTSESVAGVRALRDWADSQGIPLLVGLSVGRPVHRLPALGKVRLRLRELRSTAVRDSRANVVAARHTLARLGMAWLARRAGLPLLVWTVDGAVELRRWLRPSRAWMVVTNEPELAVRLRDSVR